MALTCGLLLFSLAILSVCGLPKDVPRQTHGAKVISYDRTALVSDIEMSGRGVGSCHSMVVKRGKEVPFKGGSGRVDC